MIIGEGFRAICWPARTRRVAWLSGMSVPSMFSDCGVCCGNHGIPMRTTAASACPVTLFGVEVALSAVEVAELFASMTLHIAPGEEDARRRLVRRAFLRTFVFWLLFPPRWAKLSPSRWQWFFILCNGDGPSSFCILCLQGNMTFVLLWLVSITSFG